MTDKSPTKAIMDAAWTAVNRRPRQEHPPLLYHFTDAAGLIGMASFRKLWVGFAAAMNDCSEIKYGTDLAAETVRGRIQQRPSGFYSSLLHHIENASNAPEEGRIELVPFVSSFCPDVQRSSHWLHYGRSGLGVALGFETAAFAREPNLDLIRIDYDVDSQRERISRVIEDISIAIHPYLEKFARTDAEQTEWLAGMTAAAHIRSICAEFKDPSFCDEREWRIISHQFRLNGALVKEQGRHRETKYRVVNGRVVAYEEVDASKWTPFPLAEVVLGYSCPIEPTDGSLQMLLSELGRHVTVRRSSVPVR